MPRLAATLLLALLVVGAQQAALVHEIGHGLEHGAPASAAATAPHDAAGGGKAANKQAASSYCEQCFQFAHVCGAGFLSSRTVGVIAARSHAERAREVADLPADPPQSRSRGPPVLL